MSGRSLFTYTSPFFRDDTFGRWVVTTRSS